MSFDDSFAAGACIFVFVFGTIAALRVFKNRRPHTPYPPGPPGDPLLGNARQIPSHHMHKTFAEWSTLYRSDIIHLRVLGQSMIVLNSYKAVTALLEQRSSIYSDRPRMTMTAELMGFEWATVFTKYGSQFKKNRKLLHHALNPVATRAYGPMQEHWNHRYLLDVLRSPDHVEDHVRRLSSVIALEVAYGRGVATTDDNTFVTLAQEAMNLFSVGVTGGWLVDFLPSLKHVPWWFPGAHFKRIARKARPIATRMMDLPFDAVKASIAAGVMDTSFTHSLLSENGAITRDKDEEDLIKKNAATLFGAGADTMVSVLMSFVLAMTLYPEVQRKAQEEIDAVIGRDRLPEMRDRRDLPYVDCIVKEVLRWNPAGPIGSPRRVMEDDIYKGYMIPAGATIIPNVWALCHDVVEYPKPDAFIPERYEGPHPARDPHAFVFGFGRRICPGLAFSSATTYIFVAQMLATFNIEKALDEVGNVKDPNVHYISGLISHPSSFDFSVSPRSTSSELLVKSVAGFVV